METGNWPAYARASLGFALLMGVVTTVHHLHAHVFVPHDGPGLHVVWNEVILLPATWALFTLYVRRGNRIAFGIYLTIVFAGFVGLGLYEGFWNHTAKIIGHLRLDIPGAELSLILPPDDPHRWFYEITGVATLVVAMLASWYTVRFAMGRCVDVFDHRPV
jgi:hypothetical protein